MENQEKSKLKAWLQLISVCIGCIIFLGFIAPRFIALFPTWVAFNKVQEEHNIESGALYYYHVPIIWDAEAAVKAGVKKGMELRRERLEREEKEKELNK